MITIDIKGISKYYYVDVNKNSFYWQTLKERLSSLIKNPLVLFKNTDKRKKFWALRNIKLKVERGETIGIIGANGAGKTTLLKIISGITTPTRGEIRLRGKLISLLKIGMGLHPDLTARENIFLEGILLGLTKKQIENDFNTIVKFSDISKFLNVPIKQYSSGMRLRLAFAIATSSYVKPDILLIDEILAVGDAQFHKKSLERIQNLIKEYKPSVLFVSHNLENISTLCTKCIWLDKGKIKMVGLPKTVIKRYLKK